MGYTYYFPDRTRWRDGKDIVMITRQSPRSSDEVYVEDSAAVEYIAKHSDLIPFFHKGQIVRHKYHKTFYTVEDPYPTSCGEIKVCKMSTGETTYVFDPNINPVDLFSTKEATHRILNKDGQVVYAKTDAEKVYRSMPDFARESFTLQERKWVDVEGDKK